MGHLVMGGGSSDLRRERVLFLRDGCDADGWCKKYLGKNMWVVLEGEEGAHQNPREPSATPEGFGPEPNHSWGRSVQACQGMRRHVDAVPKLVMGAGYEPEHISLLP